MVDRHLVEAARTRRGSIRLTLTILATLVVAAVLAASAVALVTLQRSQLTANLDSALEQRADAFVAALAETTQPSVIVNSNVEDRAAQLVSPDGVVIAATPNLEGVPPLINPLTDERTQSIRTVDDLPLEDDRYRVLTRRIDTSDGGAVLHLVENIDDVNDSIRSLRNALLISVPVVVLVLAALMWWLVGRALRPVEAIRREVADISGTSLHRRVPVPPRDDEIGRLATTMNQMLDRIDAASERQRQFVSDASHELRTPLTRIRTELEVDVAHPDRADEHATHVAVLEETIALQRLIDDLLHLARSDAGETVGRREPVDLDDIVLREVRRQRVDTPVDIDTSGVSAALVEGDPDQLTRVVRNLLENAVRHGRSRAAVTLAERPDGVELVVLDDGLGVPAEARQRIFERFGRVDDARTQDDGGTGLGLAIVRDIVEHHGGTVEYDSTWNDGARFVVRLPSGSNGADS